jgi:hypothetical protein
MQLNLYSVVLLSWDKFVKEFALDMQEKKFQMD